MKKMEQLEKQLRDEVYQTKAYVSPSFKPHLVESALSILAGSTQRRISTEGNSMEEQWHAEETVNETFTWTW